MGNDLKRIHAEYMCKVCNGPLKEQDLRYYRQWWLCGNIASYHYGAFISGHNPVCVNQEVYRLPQFLIHVRHEHLVTQISVKKEKENEYEEIKMLKRALTYEEVLRYQKAWNLS